MKNALFLSNKKLRLLCKLNRQCDQENLSTFSQGIEKKTVKLHGSDKAVVARHEAGHAVVGTAIADLLPGQARVQVKHCPIARSHLRRMNYFQGKCSPRTSFPGIQVNENEQQRLKASPFLFQLVVGTESRMFSR